MLSAKALSFTSRRLDGNAASPFAGLSDDLMSQIAGKEGHSWHALEEP